MKPNKEYFAHVLVVAFSLVMITLIYLAFANADRKQKAISDSIKYAIDKGVDPMAIKCAYAEDAPPLCIMYIANDKDDSSVSIIKK